MYCLYSSTLSIHPGTLYYVYLNTLSTQPGTLYYVYLSILSTHPGTLYYVYSVYSVQELVPYTVLYLTEIGNCVSLYYAEMCFILYSLIFIKQYYA